MVKREVLLWLWTICLFTQFRAPVIESFNLALVRPLREQRNSCFRPQSRRFLSNNDNMDTLTITSGSSLTATERVPQNFSQDLRLGLQQLQPFLKIAVPFFRNDTKARNSLLGISALTLVNSGMSVLFSYISRDFYNALNNHNEALYYEKIELFFLALLFAVPLSVTYSFTLDKLSIYWREELTKTMLEKYYSNQMFYVIETMKEIDNPDQRITSDIRHFTKSSLRFFITVFTSVVDLACFSFVLYQIFPNLFLAIIVYAFFGTVITTQLGQSLVSLNYRKILTEADFRFQLFRIRENAESIAFYDRDLKQEQSIVQEIFQRVLDTTLEIITVQRNIDTFTTAYRYIIQILPSLLIAPLYFQGKVGLGVINQSYSAFNHILSDFSIVINSFESLSYFAAGLTRLSVFLDRVSNPGWGDMTPSPNNHLPLSFPAEEGKSAQNDSLLVKKPLITSSVVPLTSTMTSQRPLLECRNLTIFTPDFQRVILGNLSAESPSGTLHSLTGVDFSLSKGERILIVGPSGSGKSSFVRTIAGLWQVGFGEIRWDQSLDPSPTHRSPEKASISTAPRKVFFLPQRPYNLISSLRNQIIYPNLRGVEDQSSLPDDLFLDLLRKVELAGLIERLEEEGDVSKGLQAEKDWSRILSIGEQQRLAFARVLFNQPDLVVLDEATSALDLRTEEKLYQLLLAANFTFISVGHRPSLLRYHQQRLVLGPPGQSPRLIPIRLSEVELTQELLDLTAE